MVEGLQVWQELIIQVNLILFEEMLHEKAKSEKAANSNVNSDVNSNVYSTYFISQLYYIVKVN